MDIYELSESYRLVTNTLFESSMPDEDKVQLFREISMSFLRACQDYEAEVERLKAKERNQSLADGFRYARDAFEDASALIMDLLQEGDE